MKIINLPPKKNESKKKSLEDLFLSLEKNEKTKQTNYQNYILERRKKRSNLRNNIMSNSKLKPLKRPEKLETSKRYRLPEMYEIPNRPKISKTPETPKIQKKPKTQLSEQEISEMDTQAALIKNNIESIVEELSQQFKEPEDSYRELGQNSIDSETKKLNIFSQIEQIDDTHSYLTLTFKDFGIGMTTEERDNFFLKLFKSSKETDEKKIGKYGIGISSIFALNLEEIIVSSQSQIQGKNGWALHVKGINDAPSYRFLEKNQDVSGTTISLVRKVETNKVESHVNKITEKMSYFCGRSRIPIFINGENITKPFDLETEISISKATKSLEFVIGYDRRSEFEISNNRLRLDNGTETNLLGEEWKGVSFLASSYKFKHTFSRDKVIQDSDFDSIISKISSELPNLFLKSLEVYSSYINKNQENKSKIIEKEIPTFEIETATGTIHKFNESTIKRLELSIKNGFRHVSYKEEPEEIIKRFLEYKNELEEFNQELITFRKEEKAKTKECKNAKKFISLYLKNMRKKCKKDCSDSSTKNLLSKLRISKVNRLQELKKYLPKGTEKFKIIPTLDGTYLTLHELIDELDSQSELLYLYKGVNPNLEKLIHSSGRLLFNGAHLEEKYKYGNTQENFFHTHVSLDRRYNEGFRDIIKSIKGKASTYVFGNEQAIVNANKIYAETIKETENLQQYHIEFLADIEKVIKKLKLPEYGETFYCKSSTQDNHTKGVFTKSRDGKIDIKNEGNKNQKRPGLLKRYFNFITGTDYSYKRDIVLDLNHPNIQATLDLYSYGDEDSKQTAINDMLTQMNDYTHFRSRELYDPYSTSLFESTEKKSFINKRKKMRF